MQPEPISVTSEAASLPRKGRLLYEGRSKRVFETTDAERCILEFKTHFVGTAGEGDPNAKPVWSVDVARHMFQYLESFRIPSHYVGTAGYGELLAQRMDMIPIAVVARNIAYGKLCERFGIEEGRELDFPIVELVYRSAQHDNPILNESHILAFGISTPEEIKTMTRIATKTNAVLRSFMERRHLRLIDLWLEFGRTNGEVRIGDAITPDTMRVVDHESGTIYDGTLYRLGIGNYRDQYAFLHKRLTS